MSMVQTPNLDESPSVAPPHGKVTWTEEADAMMLDMLDRDGASATWAAAQMTLAGFPATKNSILGRYYRLRKGGAPIPLRAEPPPAKPKLPLPDLTKPTGCRFIDGDACGWQSKWCDAPIDEIGGSWCEHHRAIVYRPKTEAEVQAAAGVFKNKRAA